MVHGCGSDRHDSRPLTDTGQSDFISTNDPALGEPIQQGTQKEPIIA